MTPVFSYTYSIPYLCFLMFLWLFALLDAQYKENVKLNSIFRYTVLMGLFLFIGLRGFILTDWYSYYSYFEITPTIWDTNCLSFIEESYMEPFFVVSTILFKSIYPSYFFWIFINCVIDFLLLYYLFRKNTKYVVFAFLFFYSFQGFMIEVNLLRNVKAMICFLISVQYLNNRRFIPYLLWNLLGIMFHFSASLYILLYVFLSSGCNNKKLIWGVFCFANFVFLLKIPWCGELLNIISEKIQFGRLYTIGMYTSKAAPMSLSIGYIERTLTFIVFMYNKDKLLKLHKCNRVYFNIYLCYYFFNLLFYEFGVLSERFSMLFICSYWFLYPSLIELFRTKKLKAEVYVIFFCYMFLKDLSMHDDILHRYDNLLFGIETYESRANVFLNVRSEIF